MSANPEATQPVTALTVLTDVEQAGIGVEPTLRQDAVDIQVMCAPITKVETDADYEAAGKALVVCRRFVAGIQKIFKGPKDAAFKAHKEICALEKKVIGTADAQDARITKLITPYLQQKEKERAAAQAAANAAAQDKDADAILTRAAQLEAEGKGAVAKALVDAAAATPPSAQKVESSTPQIDGMTTSWTWELVIDDPAQIPDEYWVVDEDRLKRLAKAEKDKFKVPGCHAEKKPVMRRNDRSGL
jgi:hypothetical protein